MNSKNIILTGIMGCGKTTIGKMVAERLQMRFLDLDQVIENKWGSISSLFQISEEHFRNIESTAVSEVSEMEGMVLATGGGVVKRQENINALKKKGIVFFIDRPLKDILSDIEISNRPLLKDGKDRLIEIFNERYPLYIKTCDIHLKEAKHLEDVVEMVIRDWRKVN